MSVADNACTAQESAARKLLDVTEAQFILLTRGGAGMLLVPRDQPRLGVSRRWRGKFMTFPVRATQWRQCWPRRSAPARAGIAEAVALANHCRRHRGGKSRHRSGGSSLKSSTKSSMNPPLPPAVKPAAHGGDRTPQEPWKKMGRRVGFIHVCLRFLSSQHLELLEQARSRWDRLVVGLTGKDHARALLLASMAAVDVVVICNPQSPNDLMKAWNGELLLVESATFATESL